MCLLMVARALNAARGGGSRERDTGRRSGSGSDLLRPDLEAGWEVPEPGNRGLGGQPVTPLGRATLPATGPAGQAIGQHSSGPDKIAAHGEAEPGPGQRRPGG